MRFGVVAPGQDACIRDVVWQKITKPVDAVVSSPCLLAMAVKSVDRDNAEDEQLD